MEKVLKNNESTSQGSESIDLNEVNGGASRETKHSGLEIYHPQGRASDIIFPVRGCFLQLPSLDRVSLEELRKVMPM